MQVAVNLDALLCFQASKPVLVQFPLIDVAKGAVTDEMLTAFIANKLSPRAIRKQIRSVGLKSQLGTGDRYLTVDEYLFLHDVATSTIDGVKSRYERLGWSIERGQRARDRLVQRGWLVESEQKFGQTRKLNLRLANDAARLLALPANGSRSSSPIHDY